MLVQPQPVCLKLLSIDLAHIHISQSDQIASPNETCSSCKFRFSDPIFIRFRFSTHNRHFLSIHFVSKFYHLSTSPLHPFFPSKSILQSLTFIKRRLFASSTTLFVLLHLFHSMFALYLPDVLPFYNSKKKETRDNECSNNYFLPILTALNQLYHLRFIKVRYLFINYQPAYLWCLELSILLTVASHQ